MKLILIIALVLLVGVGGFYFVGMSKNGYQTSSPSNDSVMKYESSAAPTTRTPDEVTTPAQSGNVKEFTVTGSPFMFEPKILSVNKGDSVKITFKNAKGMHDFTLDEFNVHSKQVNAGESDTVTFTADKAGSFEFYCSVSNHRQMGMKGTLVVK